MSPPTTLADADLRRAPSPAALATLCAAIHPGGRAGAVRRLRGGISSGMHAVDLVRPNGERREVVVRRYGAWRLGADPRVAEREWSTLAALARAGAPTPHPIWLDRDGAVFGCPTIVTSRLPGRGLLAPRDPAGWIRQLAETLAEIHKTRLGEAELGLLLDQHADLAHLLERDAPPPSLAKPPGGLEVWSALRRRWPRLDLPAPSLLHGDYWPGNTLWRSGRLTGVVDWEQARRGDPSQDVACSRLDLALLTGPEAPAAFLAAYEAATGRTVPNLFFWDLYMATWAIEGVSHWVSGYHDLGRTDVTADLARARLAHFTAAALIFTPAQVHPTSSTISPSAPAARTCYRSAVQNWSPAPPTWPAMTRADARWTASNARGTRRSRSPSTRTQTSNELTHTARNCFASVSLCRW